MKTGIAIVGALFASAVMAALKLLLQLDVLNPLALGILAGVTLVGYIVANLAAGSDFGEFMRGGLIGLNTVLNALLGMAIYGGLVGAQAGLIMALILAALNVLTVIGPVANNEVYQGVLGWVNWLLPMSWLVVGLGLLLFILNLLGHLILGLIFKVDFFRIIGGAVDWKTGTFFTHGGFVSNLNPIDTAFNMGNFSYVDKVSHVLHIEHEAGHTLNLGAFGSVFHFIGAIDENVTGGGRNAFSERLAESNDPSTSQSNIIPMWV